MKRATSPNDPKFERVMRGIMESVADHAQGAEPFDIDSILRATQMRNDPGAGLVHNGRMEPLNRPELDAKLEAIEARMEGRIARIEDSVQRITELAGEIKSDYREIRSDNRDIRQSVSSLKTTLIVTAIGAALTIIFGIAAFNSTLQSNMLSAFQAGQQVNQSQSK